MEITKMSSKGQIVIPQKIRNRMGIQEGSIIAIEQIKNLMVIKKMETNLKEQFTKSLADLKKGKIKKVA